jgi:leucine dehydrogenase
MIFSNMPDFDAHEEVRVFDLEHHGAKAIIAVHSTYLGPSMGGCRAWRYDKTCDAMADALRLSRGMSYKNAMADLPLGGGKSVIMLPPGDFDRRALFEAFGRAVNAVGGRYMAAEDVGSSVADMQVVATQTPFVSGLPAAAGQAGGDPSPWTALGVFSALQAALGWFLELPLDGARVSVQGAGAVGADLCRRLVDAGARVTLADINAARAQAVAEQVGAYLVAPEEIHRVEADVFAPCALGGTLNGETIKALAAPIICGAANNQLANPGVGEMLHRRGMLYCPDYLVNAGGIIAVQAESVGDTIAAVEKKIAAIPGRLTQILELASNKDLPPETVTDRIARDRIGRGDRQVRSPSLAYSA